MTTLELRVEDVKKLDDALVDIFNDMYGELSYQEQFGIEPMSYVPMESVIYRVLNERKWVYARLKYSI